MLESSDTDPLSRMPDLAWLLRGRPQRIATPCRFPDCLKLVSKDRQRDAHNSSGAGARGFFCSVGHRNEYRKRREELTQAIAELQRRLDDEDVTARARRRLLSSITYLRKVLVDYTDVRTTHQ